MSKLNTAASLRTRRVLSITFAVLTTMLLCWLMLVWFGASILMFFVETTGSLSTLGKATIVLVAFLLLAGLVATLVLSFRSNRKLELGHPFAIALLTLSLAIVAGFTLASTLFSHLTLDAMSNLAQVLAGAFRG